MILICRHGETQWNIQARKQGNLDSPLTITGLKQGKSLANMLKDHIDLQSSTILCSPLARTKQYASIICDTSGVSYAGVTFDDRLKEHSFGLWEGLNEVEIEEIFPGMVKARESDWWNYRVPEGESYALLESRLQPFIEELSNDENYIIVTHEMVSKVMRKILLGLSEQACLALGHKHNQIMQIDKGQLTILDFA